MKNLWLIFIAQAVIQIVYCADQLRLANVVYRHGDRSPVSTFPTDTYKENHWPQGFGQLSRVGMKQQYKLGEFFHKRYMVDNILLNQTYIRYQIHIQSTDIDRTLMSAEADLAALYPPKESQMWNGTLLWQPIPVHTMSGDEDLWLNEFSYCPEYTALQNKSYDGKEYVNMSNKYKDFLAKINSKSGYNGSISIKNIFLVNDPLKIEREHKLTLPNWASAGVMANLSLLNNYSMGQQFDTVSKNRYRGGALLGLILENIKEFINSTVPEEKQTKFFMYSSHDTTVVALASALGVWDGCAPPYATALGIELWEDDNGNYSIRMWYRNETDMDTPIDLKHKDCPESCPLDKFKSLTKNVVISPDEIKRECGIDLTYSYLIPMVVGITLAAMLIVFVAGYWILITRSKVKHQRLYDDDDMVKA